jgi:hypothetical protein
MKPRQTTARIRDNGTTEARRVDAALNYCLAKGTDFSKPINFLDAGILQRAAKLRSQIP